MQTVLLCLFAIGIAAGVPILTATPSELATSGDNVTLEWSGVDAGFTIAVFRYPETLISIGHIKLNSSAGSISIPLLNARSNVFFTLCNGVCETIAEGIVRTDDVRFAMGDSEPTQGHLALIGDDKDTLILRFTSGVRLAFPQVRYATTLAALASSPNVLYGMTEEPYTIEDMCFAPASNDSMFYSPGFQHEVRLDGLTPGTVYHLQFGSNETNHWSRTFTMTSPEEEELETHIIFGDLGVTVQSYTPTSRSSWVTSSESVQWMKVALSEGTWMTKDSPWRRPSLITHIGDISYARGYPDIWEHFMSSIEPLAMQVPYMVSVGNHEYDYVGHGQKWDPSWWGGGTDSGGECGVAFSSRFHMPEVADEYKPEPTGKPNTRNMWYSFNKGMVHYLMVSTEHNFTEGSPQHLFTVSDLTAVNRTRTPWVIVTGHRPWYTTKNYGGLAKEGANFRKVYEPLLQKFKVDLAIYGHQHAYERMCAITTDFKCAKGDEFGTVHVIVGNAGNMDDAGGYITPTPEYSRFRSTSAHNWGVTTITANSTYLRLDYHGDYPAPLTDTVTLTK